MRLTVKVMDVQFDIEVGKGQQQARWLGLVAASRYAEQASSPGTFLLPTSVKTIDNRAIQPHQTLRAAAVHGGGIAKAFETLGISDVKQQQSDLWRQEAYEKGSNLVRCRVRWIPGKLHLNELPVKVCGNYMVDNKWLKLFPQAEFGGPFDLPLEAVDAGDGAGYHWDALIRAPPGTAVFKFVLPDGKKIVCNNIPVIGNTEDDHAQNIMHFKWDAPIVEDPEFAFDKVSTVSSGGRAASKDPRFRGDWEKLKLTWLEGEDQANVKDVLIEFYEALIDLFDSYAFMGVQGEGGGVSMSVLSVASSAAGEGEGSTIGADDFKHLMEGGVIDWSPTIKGWLCEINPALFSTSRLCLQQRLERYQYLDLLVRVAIRVSGHTQDGVPPADEAVFQFIKEVLLPVMDEYDEDYIRRQAVEKENLIVLQKYRTTLRSLHFLLQQPCPFEDDEMLVAQDSLEFVLKLCSEGYYTGEGEHVPTPEGILTGEERLERQHVDSMLRMYDGHLADVLRKRPMNTEKCGMYFWEFFEMFMYLCDSIKSSVAIHDAIPRTLGTLMAMLDHMTSHGIQLPRRDGHSLDLTGAF
ncbi:hypothetical protein FOL46_009602 [Perkinsus olseni]|uniref:Uncharacterized protein n=1 Tax=Perkinsus olseni TaxID=32597 RepID=A0A7J6L1P1_PEROL|nr:hypothetical protein FOL46_009602 [Perkinsus olseni]